PGRAYYVGDAKCAGCHKPAMAFWKKTVHASAWHTLVVGGKQDDYKCVSCHVTGYGEVGGSSLGHTDRLRDVQCEVCHGPGSKHVAEEGTEDPPAVHRQTPASTCTVCHTEQHSDTFQYEAYLRDIIGAGHGPAARGKLGDGPTGHSLRTAALARAKVAGKQQAKTD
ncbi:MAG TPA: cytochrome c family protein, partial [Vicinamibacterales bacterium]|nr:cytochrome c family protein [Vicinamibacterales bacterium]